MQFGNPFVFNDESLSRLPAYGNIQVRYLGGLAQFVRSRGCDARKVLEHHDVDPIEFENPDYQIACGTAVNLLEYCSGLLKEPLFGLQLAEQQDPEVFGCAVALARAAPTMREALQCLVDYVPLGTPDCELEVVRAREVVELRWRTHTGFGDMAQPNYQGLLLIAKTLQMLGGRHFHPSYATLTFRVERSNIDTLQQRLGCRVSGKAEAHAIAFPRAMMDLPIATSNKMLFGLLGSALAELRMSSRAGFLEQVEAYVRSELSSGNCSVDRCAEKLGTSSRTLQKRLTRLDVKFSDIVQNERTKLAKHALLWSDCSLDEIAFQLGYSEQTSFGRAFKRSTGITPQAFRVAGHREHFQSASVLEPV